MSVAARQQIAIYGGSFDPPHVAHVLTVAWLISATAVDEVWIAPVALHPLGKHPSRFSDRLALCALAFSLFGKCVRVIDDENRPGGSGRTLDLLLHLQSQHPSVDFRFVLGTDQVAQRHRWHRFDEVMRLAPPIVVGRPGFAGAEQLMPTIELPAVASTTLRAALRAGESVDGLVPKSVLAYIETHWLYRDAP